MDESKKVLILLNDRDPFLARVFQNKFKKIAGWESIITENFDDAIKIVELEKPDILLTEIIVNDSHGRNGFDLLQKIKEIVSDFPKEFLIIVLTELSQEADRKKALEMGADEYVVKSQITAMDLILKIKSRIN